MHRATRRRRPVRLLVLILAALVALTATACGGGAGGSEKKSTITIAYQPGIGYAPLLMIKEQQLIEKELPDIDVEWKVLDSGAAIRDGVISGEIDVAAGGTAPFLVGRDAGVDWKAIMSIVDMDLRLMAEDEGIESLEDLEGGDAKIAMPAPDSIQSVILRKGAAEEIDDPDALDSQIVSMAHPDAVQALAAGQIAAHLGSPPFQGEEAGRGAHEVLSSYDLFGQHTANSLYARSDFVEANGEFVSALESGVEESVTLLNKSPDKAAAILSEETGGEVSKADLVDQVTGDDVDYATTPSGFEDFASFMADIDMIKEVPEASDMFFENKYTSDAS